MRQEVDGNYETNPHDIFTPYSSPIYFKPLSSFISQRFLVFLIAYQTMQRAAAVKDQPRRSSGVEAAEGEKVFRGDQEFGQTSSNYLKTILALALWLGTFHLNAGLLILALLFLSLRQALLFVSLSCFYSLE